MTLTDILAWVADRLPDGYFSSILTTAKLTSLVNKAQQEVCRRHNFQWMKRECTQATTDSQQRYTLPDGTTSDLAGVTIWRFKHQISLEMVDAQGYRWPLTLSDKKDIERDLSFANAADTGIPSQYAIDQANLWLYQVPNHAYNSGSAWAMNLEYYGYLPDLSGSLTNWVTENADDLLNFGCLSRALEIGEDWDKVGYWKGKFDEFLSQLIQEDLMAVHGPRETGLQPVYFNAIGNAPDTVEGPQTSGGYVDGTP
jgi:hypothetical protein